MSASFLISDSVFIESSLGFSGGIEEAVRKLGYKANDRRPIFGNGKYLRNIDDELRHELFLYCFT